MKSFCLWVLLFFPSLPAVAAPWTQESLILQVKKSVGRDLMQQHLAQFIEGTMDLTPSYNLINAGFGQFFTDLIMGQIHGLYVDGKLWDNTVDFYTVQFLAQNVVGTCFEGYTQILVRRTKGDNFVVNYGIGIQYGHYLPTPIYKLEVTDRKRCNL